MRKAFVESVTAMMEEDARTCLLLGDIGVHGFYEVLKRWPDRAWNIGVCEQSMVSMAAGLARACMFPIVHSIAPFLVLRALEQIKIDFGYQELPGMFVSVGASFDYSTMGATHQCPEDVEVMKTIPNMSVYVPWDEIDAKECLRQARHVYGGASYIRLAETESANGIDGILGRRPLQRKGTKGTVIAVGTTLPAVIRACAYMDVTIIYLNKVAPFPNYIVRTNVVRDINRNVLPILTVEPYYEGVLVRELSRMLVPKPPRIETIGVDRSTWHRVYGTRVEHKQLHQMTDSYIEQTAQEIFGV